MGVGVFETCWRNISISLIEDLTNHAGGNQEHLQIYYDGACGRSGSGLAVVTRLKEHLRHSWCGNARTFCLGDSRNYPSKRCIAVRQLAINPDFAQDAPRRGF
jgi:hypothetical protein